MRARRAFVALRRHLHVATATCAPVACSAGHPCTCYSHVPTLRQQRAGPASRPDSVALATVVTKSTDLHVATATCAPIFARYSARKSVGPLQRTDLHVATATCIARAKLSARCRLYRADLHVATATCPFLPPLYIRDVHLFSENARSRRWGERSSEKGIRLVCREEVKIP